MEGYRYRNDKRKCPYLRRVPAYLALFACILTGLPLTGCGDAAQAGGDEVIQLHEPGTGTVTTERVAVRDLYNALVYEGAVYPYIEEYSFETDQVFGSYNVLLGDEVQKGDVLFTADLEALDEQIRDVQEQINELKKEHEKYLRNQEENLYIMRSELEQLKQILDNLEAQKPEETVLDEEGAEVANPEYDTWLKGANGYQEWYGKYSLKEHYIDVGENELQQKKELYALDYGYYGSLLGDLKEERARGVVASGISGKVVSLSNYAYNGGDPLPGGLSLIAVGDPKALFIKCGYVAEAAVEKAADVYALIGGKRYEVTLQESDFRQQESSSVSTFSFRDESGQVEAGDYAVLVLVSNYRENVLTVPAQSVYSEGADRFVHVVEDGVTVSRKVETGMSDGVYTEILSGLEEGDRVVAQIQRAGDKTAVLERTDMRTEFQAAANLYYPRISWVKNTVKNGTVRFMEYRVVETSYVEKGDVIAAVQVEGDSVELMRREREVQRAKERLADLEASLDMTREENAERIAQGQESIRKQEEEIRQLRSDYAVTELRAEASGYVEYLIPHSAGEVLSPGEFLGYIAEESVTYLALGNSGGNLNYADVVNINYVDMEGNESIAQGKILTVGNLGLSEYLASTMMLAEVPLEMQENMQVTEKRMLTVSFRSMPVNGSYQEVPDVVLVPVEAVTIRNGRTYVNILEEDGSVMPMGFLAGGRNEVYYWVIDGLTEGMKICWE